MVIAINTRFLLQGKLEGIGWFTYETVKRMVLAHPEHQFIFIFDRPYSEQFVFAKNVRAIVVPPPARHPILWYWWFEVSIPKVLKRNKVDVFLSPDGFASLTTKVPQVLVIHDLAFKHNRKYISKLYAWYCNYFTPRFAKKVQAVVGVSQYTVQDVKQAYGIPDEKLHLVYNSANDVYRPFSYEERTATKARLSGGEDYFIYAGSLHPRKNLVNLLKAFEIFKRSTKSTMKLILVGRLAWKTDAIVAALRTHPNAADIVRIEYLEAAELCQAIGAAYALTYVSEFEGFGIPILEALRCNVPVITSSTSSMPEVGGDAALYANPYDAIDIADQLVKIYTDENCRNMLRKAAPLQAAKFDWQVSADRLYRVCMSVVASR
jgi:glycosyltransferase involved in cell wall biosynthesis